jgi:hypothetical protein
VAETARWCDLIFLGFERGVIGVTAGHVVSAYEAAVEANPNVVCQLRTSPAFDLTGAIIARDAARDLATFEVSDNLLTGRTNRDHPTTCRASLMAWATLSVLPGGPARLMTLPPLHSVAPKSVVC